MQIHTRNLLFFECLASETRLKMLELLDEQPRSIKELAQILYLSSAVVTKHIQKMEEAGIVGTESVSGTRGRRKVCRIIPDAITLQFRTPIQPEAQRDNYSVSIPVGQYSNAQIKPTCGLSSGTAIIGIFDDPRYFSDPEHVKARHLWFGSGFVEYRIPNYLVGGQRLQRLSVSLEICSESPGYNESWPSDISFYLNDVLVGAWTSPGDFGSRKGAFTPDWWKMGTQHGLLKQLSIGSDGSYIDGVKLSDVTTDALSIRFGDDIRFRIACHDNARHCGGVSLFGRGFGNYDQDIEVSVQYAP